MRRLLRGERVPLSFAIITALCVAVLGVQGCAITQNRERAREGRQAHDAICALKGDLARRIEASQDFLAKHPKGIDGISATDISISIANQQLTLDALSPVRCTAAERKPTTTGKAQP
jgi:hypothetical protein